MGNQLFQIPPRCAPVGEPKWSGVGGGFPGMGWMEDLKSNFEVQRGAETWGDVLFC